MLNLKKMQLATVAAVLACGAVGVQAGEPNKNAGSDQWINEKTDSGYKVTDDNSAGMPTNKSESMSEQQTSSDAAHAMEESEQAMEESGESLEESEDEMAQSEQAAEPVAESEAVLPDRWSSSDQHEFTQEPEFEEERQAGVSSVDE